MFGVQESPCPEPSDAASSGFCGPSALQLSAIQCKTLDEAPPGASHDPNVSDTASSGTLDSPRPHLDACSPTLHRQDHHHNLRYMRAPCTLTERQATVPLLDDAFADPQSPPGSP